MTWEADMLWEERLQRQAEMLSNTAQGFPVPQESKSKKASWPADKVERRKVKDLVPYAKNARTHSEEQIGQIAHAIEQWGWTVPCLVDEKGGLIAGHGRVLAAKKLGLDEVPVVVARGWSAAQKRAYVLADNKLTENGGWDDDLLKVEIGELQGEGFDLTLTGFSMDEIGELLDETEDGIEAAPDSKYKEQFGVIVICKDEAHQQEVFESLAGSGYEVRVVVT
jgi:ParB-like chromosome segregation protein Spo0J